MSKWLLSHIRLIRISLLGAGIWGTYEVLDWTLLRNAKANLYAPEADSIGIPLMGHVMAAILFLPFFVTVALLPVSSWLRPKPDGRKWWQICLLFWLGISYLLVLINALGSMAYLSRPHYQEAGQAGVAFVLLVLAMLVIDIRRLFFTRTDG